MNVFNSDNRSAEASLACGVYLQIDIVFFTFTLKKKKYSSAVACQEASSFERMCLQTVQQTAGGGVCLFFLKPEARLDLNGD